jgi:endoglucanase
MALSNDLYVILDMHHEDWLMPTYEKEEEVTERLTGLWKQIASEFKDHSLKLLFEGMNEPRLRNTSLEWSEGTAESYDVINHLNSAFIKTVRSTGGNNTLRYLLITDYAGSTLTKALENLEYPEDDNIIVSIHCYLPHSFTSDESGSTQWNSNSEKDTEPLRMFKNDLIELFLKKGVPVLITEYGCSEKKSGNGRMEWTKYFTSEMKEIHIHTMWWDNGGKYSLIDRESCEPSDNELIKTIVLSEKQ